MFNVFNAKNGAGNDGLLYFHVLSPDGKTLLVANNPDFGKPTIFAGDPLQGEQRLIQLGARLTF